MNLAQHRIYSIAGFRFREVVVSRIKFIFGRENAVRFYAIAQIPGTLLASAVAKMQRLYDAIGVAFSFFFFFYSSFLEFCAIEIHKKRSEMDFAVFARDYVEKA